MATQIFYPKQIQGITKAVAELMRSSVSPISEMVHVTENSLDDTVKVELTRVHKVLYVRRDGTITTATDQ